jgi:hypothetical protein
MKNTEITIRIVAFFYLIFNLIYVPIKVVLGSNTYRGYDWIFDLGEKAEIDITRLIIQSIVIILIIVAVNSPGFKKAENGEFALIIGIVRWLLTVPPLAFLIGFLIHSYFN